MSVCLCACNCDECLWLYMGPVMKIWLSVIRILSLIIHILFIFCVPSCFKHTVVHPLSLALLDFKHFRPISKLPFLLKVFREHCLLTYLFYLNYHNIFQSGFHSHHSSETALIKLTNDLLLSADAGDCLILILLNLSFAVDAVDHSVLLDHLQKWVDIRDAALDCFKSYLSNRTFSVGVRDASSSVACLTCGVPQSSILGPLLLCAYMLPHWDISYTNTKFCIIVMWMTCKFMSREPVKKAVFIGYYLVCQK